MNRYNLTIETANELYKYFGKSFYFKRLYMISYAERNLIKYSHILTKKELLFKYMKFVSLSFANFPYNLPHIFYITMLLVFKRVSNKRI